MGGGFLDDAVEGGVDFFHLDEELFKDLPAVRGEPIEAFLAVVLFPPLAGEKALRLEAAEERIKRAFVDFEAELGEVLAERVAVVLAPELGEDSDDEKAAPQLEADVFEKIRVQLGYRVADTMWNTVCVAW